jgi:Phosphate-selective porin O and P
MRGPLRAVPLATVLAALSAAARAQTAAPPDASRPTPPPTPTAEAVAGAGARGEAELEATRKQVQDLEAQVVELRRIIETLDQSRASVDDVRRRLDEMEARLRENDRRDEALATRAGGEASLFKFRGDGFAMRSPNGRFLLIPHLRLQTVYEGVLASKGTLNTAPPDQSGFTVTHAEVILEGHVGSRLFAYRLQLDAAESPTINDAYVQITPARSLGLRIGQFKVPYGLQRWTYSGDLEFVTISAPMAAFSLERDVGFEFVGRPLAGKLEYEFAIMNGSGAGQPNDNIDLAYAARIVAAPFGPLPPGEGDILWHPRPRAHFGVAGYYNLVPTDVVARTGDPTAITDQDMDGRPDNVAIWQYGAELRALWRGAALQAEWFGRYEKPGSLYASRSYQGGYVQASYFVIRGRLQLAARAGWTDEPRYGSRPEQRALFGNHVNEQSAAVSAYLRGQRVKVQVDYTHSYATDREPELPTRPAGSGPTQHRVRAAVQVGF